MPTCTTQLSERIILRHGGGERTKQTRRFVFQKLSLWPVWSSGGHLFCAFWLHLLNNNHRSYLTEYREKIKWPGKCVWLIGTCISQWVLVPPLMLLFKLPLVKKKVKKRELNILLNIINIVQGPSCQWKKQHLEPGLPRVGDMDQQSAVPAWSPPSMSYSRTYGCDYIVLHWQMSSR